MEITIKIDDGERKLIELMAKKMNLESKEKVFKNCIKLVGFMERFVKDDIITVVDIDANEDVRIMFR